MLPYISWAGKTAFAFMLLGFSFTVRDIFVGGVRPNRATWGIWAILGAIVLLSYGKVAGTQDTIWVVRAGCVFPITLFLLSLFKGQPGSRRLDWICLMLALPCFPLMMVSPLASLAFGLIINGIGAAPTITKATLDPKSESRNGWSCGFVGGAINLFAISEWNWVTASHPIYIMLLHLIMTPLLWIPRKVVVLSNPVPVTVPKLQKE